MMTRILVIVMTFWVLWIGPLVANAGHAECLVRITYDAGDLPLGYMEVSALVTSTGIVGEATRPFEEAMRDYLSHGGEPRDVVSVAFLPATDGSRRAEFGEFLLGTLAVDVETGVENHQWIAEQILAGVCGRLDRVLAETAERDRKRLSERYEAARAALEHASSRMSALQARDRELRVLAGYDLDRKSVIQLLRDWQRERRNLEAEFVATQARQQARAQEIARIAEEARQKAQADEVLKQLEELVALRQTQVERCRVLIDKGSGTETDMADAIEAATAARIQAANQRDRIADAIGGKQIAMLNEELMRLSIEMAEKEARLAQVTARIAAFEKAGALKLIDEYETQVMPQMLSLQPELHRLARECDELDGRLRRYGPPVVTILGGPMQERPTSP